jgi:hypothetical protein
MHRSSDFGLDDQRFPGWSTSTRRTSPSWAAAWARRTPKRSSRSRSWRSRPAPRSSA